LTLTEDELHLVKQCLIAAVTGPYFPDWEFATLIGADRDEVREIAASWPQVPQDKLFIASNVLVNLYGYPHGEEVRLESGQLMSSVAIKELYGKLK
jgi:hypothetical protein